MTTHKKTNHFEELSDIVHKNKDSDFMDPSSITKVSEDKTSDPNSDLKDTFLVFQDSTTNKFYQIENFFPSYQRLHHYFA